MDCGDLNQARMYPDYCDWSACNKYLDANYSPVNQTIKAVCDILCSPSMTNTPLLGSPNLQAACERRCNYGSIENSYLCYKLCSFQPTNPTCGPDVQDRYDRRGPVHDDRYAWMASTDQPPYSCASSRLDAINNRNNNSNTNNSGPPVSLIPNQIGVAPAQLHHSPTPTHMYMN